MNHIPQQPFSPKKKIFITGIAGFIGMHLALHLQSRGDDVLGCDLFNDYYDPALKKSRSDLLTKNGINVASCDMRDSKRIHSIFEQGQITHIVHLAAQAGVRYSITNPQAYVESNLDGFVKILEISRQFGSIPFIYASSSSVYGKNTKIPFAENDPTDTPSNFYGATKKSNELIATSYHHLYDIPVTGLRFFTVYGPWGRPDMAYFSFAKALMNHQPLPIFAGGNMERDFTFIDDIIQGIASAVDHSYRHEVFNLGHNHPHSVNQLIAILEKATGKKALREHYAAQPGEVPITFADISKSQKMLNFQPKISLEEGIYRFIDWYRTYYNG